MNQSNASIWIKLKGIAEKTGITVCLTFSFQFASMATAVGQNVKIIASNDQKTVKLINISTSKEYEISLLLNTESTGYKLQPTKNSDSLVEYEVLYGKKNAKLSISTFNNKTIELKLSGTETFSNLGLRIRMDSLDAWYGGDVATSHNWPLNSGVNEVSPFYSAKNQTSPIWYSKKGLGLFVETYQTMGYSFNKPQNGFFNVWIKNTGNFSCKITFGKDIREAFTTINKLIGWPANTPEFEYFRYPVFNTWIQYMTAVDQEKVKDYASNISKFGFPYSIIEIDDKWTSKYGNFTFDTKKFPDPSSLFDSLKRAGKDIVLWVTPFFEETCDNYQFLKDKGYLVLKAGSTDVYTVEWWNGMAAMIDFSNPEAMQWYITQLQELAQKYTIGGYKLDAGDADFLDQPYKTFKPITAQQYTDLFASIGKYFKINELRVSWLVQKDGLVQRLRDKAPSWSKADGIGSLIPHALTNSLIGYPFLCPDMIGGGLDSGFKGENFKGMDQEMFVRWAQTSSLMPMMQFSYAPWQTEQQKIEIVRKYVVLHECFSDYIYQLACDVVQTGMPIIRPLFLEYPDDDQTYGITDQFLLGDRYLAAPVVTKTTARKVYLPSGNWCDFWTGKIYKGSQLITYDAPLEIMPLFVKIN